MINYLSYILIVFLQLTLISIVITKVFDFFNLHIGHQKRLFISVIVMTLLQYIFSRHNQYLQTNTIIFFLSLAIAYLILFELYSLLYRAISLQILLSMRSGNRVKMQRRKLLLIYPNGGANYIWETRLSGLLGSNMLMKKNELIIITRIGKIIRYILVKLIQIMNVEVVK